jgi:hypothetical protein
MPEPATSSLTSDSTWFVRFQTKLNRLAELIGFYSINYCFSVVVMVVLYPISEKTVAPLLSTFLPISQATLPKALLILTIMYWLPILWHAINHWFKQED